MTTDVELVLPRNEHFASCHPFGVIMSQTKLYTCRGAFHLVKNSGSGVNGNVFSVRLTGKFSEKVELLKR